MVEEEIIENNKKNVAWNTKINLKSHHCRPMSNNRKWPFLLEREGKNSKRESCNWFWQHLSSFVRLQWHEWMERRTDWHQNWAANLLFSRFQFSAKSRIQFWIVLCHSSWPHMLRIFCTLLVYCNYKVFINTNR